MLGGLRPRGATPYRKSMDYRRLGASLAVLALAPAGCFNPGNGADGGTDGDGTASDATGNPSGMTSGSPPTTGVVDTTDSEDETAEDDPTMTAGEDDPPECEVDGDCASMADECESAACDGGACVVSNLDVDTPCGDATDSDCDGADTCDGRGACVTNVAVDGMSCSDCDSGVCSCATGACEECVVFADTNLFTTERSLLGWELTGSWGLYTEAPPSAVSPAIPFGNQVLGTDGNRSAPYPGGHLENSYARTPPTELPTSLTFQSWHLDEGAGVYDNKIIRISTDDGATWTDIISCPLNPGLAFCQSVNTRAADDWDSISLDLPAPLIGQVGIIEFAYDTGDGCCEFEKGWFIDVTNFATECACATDAVCEPYGSDCGTGSCGGNGACNLDVVAADTACGDGADNECTVADTCDGFGRCLPNNAPNAQVCQDCAAGDDCNGCLDGTCDDCGDLPPTNNYDFPVQGASQPTAGFMFEATSGGGWAVYNSIPGNEDGDPVLFPADAPFLGNDGSTLFPLDSSGETVNASVTTFPDVVPETLTFASWHQDEGGNGAVDTKRIELSIDGGANWIPLADCFGGPPLNAFPFCQYLDDRPLEPWDAIELDTSSWEGMEGIVRFTYETSDDCCGFERGWFIDEMNFAQVCLAANESGPDPV